MFRAFHGDLHNLVPAVGELNAARSDFAFGEVEGEPRDFGACDFEVAGGVVEPTDDRRGDVARAYLYVSRVYALPLTAAEEARFVAWDAADPPCAWERERHARIERVQGNVNRWVAGRRR